MGSGLISLQGVEVLSFASNLLASTCMDFLQPKSSSSFLLVHRSKGHVSLPPNENWITFVVVLSNGTLVKSCDEVLPPSESVTVYAYCVKFCHQYTSSETWKYPGIFIHDQMWESIRF
jgi:hypothetical protein